MNRALLKQDAKDAMRAATPHPALTTLAYLAISIAFSMVICAVSSIFGITGALLGSETVGVFSAFISMKKTALRIFATSASVSAADDTTG